MDRLILGLGSGVGFDKGWSLDLDLAAELAKNQSVGDRAAGGG